MDVAMIHPGRALGLHRSGKPHGSLRDELADWPHLLGVVFINLGTDRLLLLRLAPISVKHTGQALTLQAGWEITPRPSDGGSTGSSLRRHSIHALLPLSRPIRFIVG